MGMTTHGITALFRALNEAQVRYLVAGGLAVIAHGHVRLTTDIDLVIELERENVLKAVHVFSGLGYRPRIPVPAESFADADLRRSWIDTKDMQVFTFWHPQDALSLVDCFIAEPFVFPEAWDRRLEEEAAPGLLVPFVGLADLLAMKQCAGRPKDLADIEALRDIAGSDTHG
jgi:hypothetical protein